MKTKLIPAEKLLRGMTFMIFDRKYIIANVDSYGSRRRNRRYYSQYNNRSAEEDCGRSEFVEVEFFMTDSYNNIQMQHMIVSTDFEFRVQKQESKKKNREIRND